MLALSNSFSISCVHSKKLFSLPISGLQEMWNGGCLYLNSYLEKLLGGIFLSKFLFITMKKHIEGLLEMLLG